MKNKNKDGYFPYPANEKYFEEDKFADNFDVSGGKLNDNEENNGCEDEENNHYSLGGDNHINLEKKRIEIYNK